MTNLLTLSLEMHILQIVCPLKILNIKTFARVLNIEVSIGKKIYQFIILYRSPNQNQEQFDKFLDNLESRQETVFLFDPFLKALISDFSTKSTNWC